MQNQPDLVGYLLAKYREHGSIEETQLIWQEHFAQFCRGLLKADPVMGLDCSVPGGGLRMQSGAVVPFLITDGMVDPNMTSDVPVTQPADARNVFNRGDRAITS